jgi:D-serine deaminase-like pyridoxal phosphate-dependent protein
MPTIHELATPALLLDVDVLEGNLQRMAERCRALGVTLRPHIKTHKCIEIGQRQRALGASGITVSTLEEAWAFATQGFDDLTWAFPVSPTRLDAVAKLNDRATLRVVADSHDAVERLEQMSLPLHVWLMVDCGYHRAGVDPDSPRATELAARLASSTHLTLDGILSHSGHAYRGPTPADVLAAAQEERDTMLRFADRLRAGGVEVPAISVGSTPAMSVIDHLDGITETRPGNYACYDHTQVVLGSCTPRDCAATVLATVVS